jgi:hypothetical protein
VTRVLGSELLKLRTTRTALAFACAGVLLAVLTVLVGILGGDPKTIVDKRSAISIGQSLSALLLLFGVVGATSEYRHRTVAPGALIVPARVRLSVGRMVAYGIAGLVVAVVLLVVAFALGIPLLGSRSGPSLRTGDYVRAAGGSVLVCWLGAMLGVAVGVLVANQVAAVVGTLVYIFVAEPLINAASHSVGKLLPGSALAAAGGSNSSHLLALGPAVVAILAWTAIFLAAAAWVDRRRDIT